MGKIRLLSGSSHPKLAQEISKRLGVSLTPVSLIRFPNDNLFCRIEESIRNDDVFIIQTSAVPVNDSLMELLLMIDAAKYASADRITAVLPYYPYVRSDKKDQPRVPVTARLVADMLFTAGADRVVTMDLHALQILSFFHMPADQLFCTKVIVDYLKRKPLNHAVVVAPDVGAVRRARVYAKALNLSLAVMDKRRGRGPRSVNTGVIIGDVRGKKAIIVDDEISTATTLLRTVDALKKQGATDIYAAAVHPVFAKGAVAKIHRSVLKEVIVTNTLPMASTSKKIKVLSIAPLLAAAIKRIHQGASVSSLFDLGI